MRVIVATSNRGKLAELGALLAPLGVELESLASLGVDSPPETGETLLENALIKARNAARATGLPALADDSGLEVDALDGAPGVRSARFAGEDADDAANNERLLAVLADVPPQARTARYRCVIAWVDDADDPAPLIGEGAWEGRIALEPRGTGGFGYDPLFELPARGVTVAQLATDEKNAASHRAQALRALVDQLRNRPIPRR